MRLLARCKECARCFDAGELPVGSSFHCHCGEVVQVQAPRGHDAAVVRCSSCGAARSGEAAACGFCGSDFTVHERDLSTVCPSCLARVSDKALFCHSCGQALTGSVAATSVSEAFCPVCGDDYRLHHRQLTSDLSILECQKCAGMWLGHECFDRLVEQSEKRNASALAGIGQGVPTSMVRKQAGPMYRRCVECKQHMARRNYGRVSGVIIDVCRDHGIWFDAHELAAILQWLRAGGAVKADRAEAAHALSRVERPAAPARTSVSSLGASSSGLSIGYASERGSGTGSLFDVLCDVVSALF